MEIIYIYAFSRCFYPQRLTKDKNSCPVFVIYAKYSILISPTEEPSVQVLICPLRLCSLAELCLQSAGAFQVYEDKKTDTVKHQGRRKLISLKHVRLPHLGPYTELLLR